MRPLHFCLRVADLERSLAFYQALGYVVVGSVPETGFGQLTMLKLADDELVSIELASDGGADRGPGLNHFVIKVESMDVAVSEFATLGVDAEEPTSPDGTDTFLTSWRTDPDGNRIELVQWPPGHADGMTSAD